MIFAILFFFFFFFLDGGGVLHFLNLKATINSKKQNLRNKQGIEEIINLL